MFLLSLMVYVRCWLIVVFRLCSLVVECYIRVLFAGCFWLLLDCGFSSFVLGFGVMRLL